MVTKNAEKIDFFFNKEVFAANFSCFEYCLNIVACISNLTTPFNSFRNTFVRCNSDSYTRHLHFSCFGLKDVHKTCYEVITNVYLGTIHATNHNPGNLHRMWPIYSPKTAKYALKKQKQKQKQKKPLYFQVIKGVKTKIFYNFSMKCSNWLVLNFFLKIVEHENPQMHFKPIYLSFFFFFTVTLAE